MNEIYVDIRGLGLDEEFGAEFVSVEELINRLEDYKCENNTLREKIEELEEYKEQYCEKYSYD